MIANASQQGRRVLSRRRLAILATVAGLGTAAMLAGHGLVPNTASDVLFAPAYAQSAQRPVGFADIVEKVKPAVMSVRVKMEAPSNSMTLHSMAKTIRCAVRRSRISSAASRSPVPAAGPIETARRASVGNTPPARAPASSSPPTAMR